MTLRARRLVWMAIACAVVSACATTTAPPPAQTRAAAPTATNDAPAQGAAGVASTDVADPTAPLDRLPASSSSASPPPPPRVESSAFGAAPFPPPAFRAPYLRTARVGDGVWAPYDHEAADHRRSSAAGGPSTGQPPLLVRTTVHTDPLKPQCVVTIVAADLARIAVHLVAGTREPPSTSVPPDHRHGVVPAADRPSLLVVHNGGFLARHGGYGMKIGDDLFLAPQSDACAVVTSAEGAVRVGPWSALAAEAQAAYAFRQTPPCLVLEAKVNPALLALGRPKRWGGSESGDYEIRRSAIGVAEGGRTLFFGLGEWVTPKALAEAMQAAGAVTAAELDVNWSYTRFFVYDPTDGTAWPDPIAPLIPKLPHPPGEYVTRPSERDFFYWTRRR